MGLEKQPNNGPLVKFIWGQISSYSTIIIATFKLITPTITITTTTTTITSITITPTIITITITPTIITTTTNVISVSTQWSCVTAVDFK
ncbi:hypothetical protein FHG87_015278 [Trinorchestia longiramus]|nr:hypothetical protein FHG87_015278 [Trinorchestia longiramus]